MCWRSSLPRMVGVKGCLWWSLGLSLRCRMLSSCWWHWAPTSSPLPVWQIGIMLEINWLTKCCYVLPSFLLNTDLPSSLLLSGQGMKWWGCRFLSEVQYKASAIFPVKMALNWHFSKCTMCLISLWLGRSYTYTFRSLWKMLALKSGVE